MKKNILFWFNRKAYGNGDKNMIESLQGRKGHCRLKAKVKWYE